MCRHKMNESRDSKSVNDRSSNQETRHDEKRLEDFGEQEPSVLDYFKSVLTPWRGKPIPFPTTEGEPQTHLANQKEIPDPQVTVTTEFTKKTEIDSKNTFFRDNNFFQGYDEDLKEIGLSEEKIYELLEKHASCFDMPELPRKL